MLKTISLFLSVSLLLLVASCGSDKTSDQKAGNAPADTVANTARQQVANAPAETVAKPPAGKPVSNEPVAKVEKKVTCVTMPANTKIAVTLVDSIDTDVQLSGAEFRAKLSGPIVVGEHVLFAEGAEAKGLLNRVVESGRLKTPAELDYSLIAIKDRDGNWVNVGTNMIQEKKASHTAREVAMIGGGAVVGGVIGKVIDKKGSTEIGAAAGAAAGAGMAAATGKQDIFYGAGTSIEFFSSEPTEIPLK